MPGKRSSTLVVAGLSTAGILLAGCAVAGSTPADPPGNAITAGSVDEPDDEGATCTADDFEVEIVVDPAHRESGLVTVTNASEGHCDVEGWTGLTVLDADDQPVQVPFKQVDQPGPGTGIDLAPGASAYAGVHFTLGDEGDDDAYPVEKLMAIPASTNDSTPAKLIGAAPGSLVISSIEMGTLQRSEAAVQPL